MTVAAQIPFINAVGNGVTTLFPFPFLVLKAGDLVVAVDGSPKVLGVDYTLTGLGNLAGGNCTLTVAPANGAAVLLRRMTSLTRDVDYQDNGDLPAGTLNLDLDRLWLALQEQGNLFNVGTFLRVPPTELVNVLPSAASRANTILGFDALGQPALGAANPGSLLPAQTGNAGKALFTDGANPLWSDAAGLTTVSSIAALRLLAKAANKFVIVTGYYAARDGGGGRYLCDLPDVTTADNGGSVIVGADSGRWKLVTEASHYSIKQFGARCNGTVADQTAIMACDAAARAAEKSVLIEGTPLITATMELLFKTNWIFTGNHATTVGGVTVLPTSYLVKDAAMTTACVIINNNANGGAVKFDGGGIYCRSGNSGDGLAVWGNNFAWIGCPWFGLAGRDNIRIGRDIAPSNANSFYFEKPTCQYAGRHNINLDDTPTLPPNANAGLIVAPYLQFAGQCGIRFGNASLGNVILCPTIEFNQTGLFFDEASSQNIVIGGDIEANTLNFTEIVRFQNFLQNVVIEGIRTDTSRLTKAWIPQVFGLTTAGAPVSNPIQLAGYTFSNGSLHFWIELSWTGHTGTGQMAFNLPDLTGTSIGGRVPLLMPDQYILPAFSETLAVAAGGQLVVAVDQNTWPIRGRFFVQNAGALTAFSVQAAGKIYVSGSVPIYAM